MKRKTAKELISATPLLLTDAVRVVMEALEGLGERAQGLGRVETLALLRRMIREGTQGIEAAEQTAAFEVAAWQSVEARSKRRPTTRRDLRHYVRRMLRVEGVGAMPLRKMSATDCRRLLQQAFGNSPSSYKKGRAILHSIFAFGMRQDWCDGNPVDKVDVPGVEERPIEPLSPQQVRQLEKTAQQPAHREMQLSLHLMLYCGIRPTEVQRLRPEDIDWKHRQVLIRPQTSKTGGGRIVPLRGIARLQHAPRMIPQSWLKRWNALRQDAGFSHNWVPDVCRHTFASYHAAHFRNLPELQLEMGHRDCNLLRSRYMMPTLQHHAAQFWQVKSPN